MRRLFAVLLLLAACSGEPAATTTSPPETLWGFTPFPAAPTQEAVGEAFAFAAEEGDLIAHHFDAGIPWSHLLDGDPLPAGLAAELDGRAGFDAANPDLVVYAATALTDADRTGIPGAVAGDAVPSGLADTFSDARVRQALHRWVDLLVERLDPDYLNIGVEIDMYAANRPDDWENLLSLYAGIYERIREEHPGMVVFASFQAELGDPGVFDQVVPHTDVIGISTYPHIGFDGLPAAGYLDRFAAAGLPMVIAETGFPAAEVASPRGPVPSDPAAQAGFVRRLGQWAEEAGLQFVVWFFPTDIDAFVGLPDVPESAAAFEHLGLLDADGDARPGLDVWRGLRAEG